MLNNYIIMQKYRTKLKFIFLLIIYLSFNFMCFSQNPIGAWERYYEDENGTKIRSVVIFSEKFQSIVMFNADSGEFIYSNGGVNFVHYKKMILPFLIQDGKVQMAFF